MVTSLLRSQKFILTVKNVLTMSYTCAGMNFREFLFLSFVYHSYLRTGAEEPMQTVQNQIRRHKTRRLIWFYTVCHMQYLPYRQLVKLILQTFRTSISWRLGVPIFRANIVFIMLTSLSGRLNENSFNKLTLEMLLFTIKIVGRYGCSSFLPNMTTVLLLIAKTYLTASKILLT